MIFIVAGLYFHTEWRIRALSLSHSFALCTLFSLLSFLLLCFNIVIESSFRNWLVTILLNTRTNPYVPFHISNWNKKTTTTTTKPSSLCGFCACLYVCTYMYKSLVLLLGDCLFVDYNCAFNTIYTSLFCLS